MTAARNPNSAGHPQTRARAEHLGAVVRRHRRRLCLSQERLGERAGWDRQSVNRLENAQFSPSLHRLWLLADALGVPLEQLLREATVAAAGQRTPGRMDRESA